MSDKKTIWSAALTVIGVNVAIFAVVIQIALTNMSCISQINARIDQVNARTDQVQQRTDAIQLMIYDTLKELKK